MSLFGTSGIRGDSEKLLTDQFCASIGRAFVKFLENHNATGAIAVGMDPRKSSPRIKDALFNGLAMGGVQLFDEGVCPIPAMCWLQKQPDIAGTIMITGSHIAPNLNGLKFFAMDEEITKEHEAEIEKLYEEVKEEGVNKSIADVVQETRAQDLYKQILKDQAKPIKKMKIVVDSANGAQSVVMPSLLRELGMDVVEVNCDPQSDFIGRDTDTDDKAFIDDLKRTVVSEKAALGIAFDGDGDRSVFIDEHGNFVLGEYSCSLIAQKEPGDTIVTTIAASSVVDTVGKKVVRTKVGSPYIIAAMKENSADFGFEQNGGAVFAKNIYTRDGGSVMIKILSLFSDFNGSFSELVATLPKFYMHRTKLDCPTELNSSIIEGAKSKFNGAKVEEMDGLKIWQDEKTWILFRPSANASEFRVFAESNDEARARQLLEDGINLVKEIISPMANNFSTSPHQERVNKPWGYELTLSPPDAPVTSKILHLNAIARFSLHYHNQKEEVLTLLNGDAILHIEDETGAMQQIKMESKKGYFVRTMQKHRCEGVTDCDIMESSTTEVGNTIRIEDDYNRGTETEESRKSRTQTDVYMG